MQKHFNPQPYRCLDGEHEPTDAAGVNGLRLPDPRDEYTSGPPLRVWLCKYCRAIYAPYEPDGDDEE